MCIVKQVSDGSNREFLWWSEVELGERWLSLTDVRTAWAECHDQHALVWHGL